MIFFFFTFNNPSGAPEGITALVEERKNILESIKHADFEALVKSTILLQHVLDLESRKLLVRSGGNFKLCSAQFADTEHNEFVLRGSDSIDHDLMPTVSGLDETALTLAIEVGSGDMEFTLRGTGSLDHDLMPSVSGLDESARKLATFQGGPGESEPTLGASGSFDRDPMPTVSGVFESLPS